MITESVDESHFMLGFDAGWEAAIQYLRRWPKEGYLSEYFGSAQHYADALSANRQRATPSPVGGR